MRRTDYEEVSKVYDDNADRRRIPVDDVVGTLVQSAGAARIAVLDLACGTGNYLELQTKAFAGAPVDWFGIDASPGMLSRAQAKLTGVELGVGRAEQLPYAEGRFDYVISSFAFHHFEDKARALDEIARVLRPKGIVRIANVAPSHMQRWWGYRYFPESWPEDEKRFWSPTLIVHELEARGFDVRVKIDIDRARVPLRSLLADAERRDISQIALLPAPVYERRLAQLREAVERSPEERVPNELAIFRCTATRVSLRALPGSL